MPRRARFQGWGSWSGAVPVVVALLLGGVLLPRGVPPDDVPLPKVDGIRLDAAQALDDHRVARVRREPLSADVRELGSAVRAFHVREAQGVARGDATQMRADIERLLPGLLEPPEPLLALRAVQMTEFIAEVHRYESTGRPSEELTALGGTFLESMRNVGWVVGDRVLLDDAELRVAFKMAWNGVVGVDARPAFALSPDETRLLYAFYLAHPHPSEQAKVAFETALRGARDAKACEALRAGEVLAAERWRLEKIERLAALDPSYPADFARGVSLFRLGRYDQAARSFETFLGKHKEGGGLTLRAQNYLKASLDLGS